MQQLDCPSLDLQTEVDQLRVNEQLLKQRHLVLLRLALSQLHPEHSFGQKLKEFTEAVSDYFQVARVGVWLLNRDATRLKCQDLFTRDNRKHVSGGELATHDYPDYFASLSQQRVIAASNADTDPRTREFAKSYLALHGISSLLETPIRVRGELRGVFCCEHVGSPRHWTSEDQQFVAVLADMVTMTITAHDVQGAEEQLRKSEQLYRSVVEDQTDLVARYTPDGTRILVNEAYCRYYSRSRDELVGRKIWELLSEDEQAIVSYRLGVLTPNRPADMYEHAFKRPDGSYAIMQWLNRAIFDEAGQVREFQAIGRDVTNQRKSEERLRVAEQLESTAMLASGIAHDFNNLLTPILANAEQLRSCQSQQSECRLHADEILAAARQAKDLVSQLLFLGHESGEENQLSLPAEEAIRASLRIISNSLPAEVQFHAQIDLNGQAVLADPTDIYQILSNLCTNASQAMEVGEITVQIDATEHQGAPYLRMAVSDTGEGIPREMLRCVFDPYFSTKEKGEGTGLGLSIVSSIVSRLRGEITVDSQPGKGTKFVVLLPCVSADERESIAPPGQAIPNGASRPGQYLVVGLESSEEQSSIASNNKEPSRRILVVDDEELVRNAMVSLLTMLGHDTLAVSTIDECLTALQRDPVDTIFLDMNLGNENGLHAVSRLRERVKVSQPQQVLRIIGMSGNGGWEQLAAEDEGALLFDGYLSKPFSGEDLNLVLSRPAAG